ncbi:MAG: BatA domain-containing protein [Pirellula sp.]
MTFLHISLLLGSIVVAAPVLLHMLGRRQPKPQPFPALRFVRQTAITAQRGWSVKRWLLLALRCLMVLALAVALAAPRVSSALFANTMAGGILGVLALLATAVAAILWGGRRSRWGVAAVAGLALALWGGAGDLLSKTWTQGEAAALGNSDGPVCAAIIVDTSPTMAYKYRNATRMEEAKGMVRWLMDRLPVSSQIAIVASDGAIRLNQDRLSAERQLDRVVVEGKATRLADRIRGAIDTLRKSDLERREIYILTDMRDNAWQDIESSDVPAKLAPTDEAGEKQPKILLQLIDLGVPESEIKNWSIANLKLSADSALPGGQVALSADVKTTRGTGNEQVMVELAVEPIDRKLPILRDGKVVVPEAKLVDRQLIQVAEDSTMAVQMSLKNLAEGTNHAVLRLARPDPLDLDNVHYITIEARTQGRTLILSDQPRDGQLVALMLDPNSSAAPSAANPRGSTDSATEEGVTIGQPPQVEPTSRIGQLDLGKVSHIVLYNPKSLTANDADRLLAWVDGGGGLLVVLGPAASSAEEIAASGLATLMPGTIKRQTRRAPDDFSVVLSPVIDNHPVWTIFERPIQEIPWVSYPVFRHWDLEGLQAGTVELMRFTGSNLPALVEWTRGQGRLMVMTLPYPEPSATAATQPWSELFTTSADAWPGYALFLGASRYLASHNKHPVNYSIDTVAMLDNAASQYPKTYELFLPIGDAVRIEAADELVSYAFTKQPGHYRLKGLRARGPVARGFSVNIDRREMSMQRVDLQRLDQILGKDTYLVAKDKEEVQSSIGEGRYGRDMAPFLLVILVMMFMAEQTMSSRFYATAKRGAA